ncbi:MAG TPA: BBP7 family outer membrane beta-barrel protein [Gemmataceae bacterium]|nr:BBP7 family outer membrane beta-barrel protein [Gemmataceae bacterium]
MRKRILALGIVVIANSLAWGQSPREKSALSIADAESVRPNLETPDSPEPKVRHSIFSLKEFERPVAANAEDAELLEATTHRTPRLWVRAEFMIWWIKPANFPPLVTTGDFADPAPGAFSSLSTNVLFGNTGMDFFDRKGGRFSAGWWLDDEQMRGLEAGYFFLGGRSINQGFISPGNPVLATPFFNVITGMSDSSLVAFPGIMSGQVAVDAPSFLQGAEANLSAALVRGDHFRLQGLAGFRWLNLSEGLHITESSLVTLAPQFVGLIPFDGNTITVIDNFDTHNHFYGGQIGTRAELQFKRWSLSLLTKVALGVSHEVVTVGGFTGIDTQPAKAVGAGLLAVSSNSGQFSRNAFAVVPEAGLDLGFQLTDRIRVFGGYSFLYWSNVARPGDQVDTSVNPNLVPTSTKFGVAGGPARPAFAFRSTDFFAHGVNLGLEVRY